MGMGDDFYLAKDVKQFIKNQEIRFNNLAKNLPQEDNHNFNRNSIIGKIKGEVSLMKAEAGKELTDGN